MKPCVMIHPKDIEHVEVPGAVLMIVTGAVAETISTMAGIAAPDQTPIAEAGILSMTSHVHGDISTMTVAVAASPIDR